MILYKNLKPIYKYVIKENYKKYDAIIVKKYIYIKFLL